MAIKDFLLPDLGEGLTEGEVVRWLVAVGDAVAVDQPVAEVETAKAVVEVPSPFSGTVTALHASAGEEVAVGHPLLSVEEGEQAAAVGPAAEPHPPADSSDNGESKAGESDAGESDAGESDAGESGNGESGSVLVGYGTGTGGRARRRRGHESPPPAPVIDPGRPLAKPPVRKLAKDLGVDLAAVPATGPGGTVTREDIHAHAEAPAQVEQEPAHQLAVAPPPGVAGDRVERIPVRGVRKRVAEKMTRSRREIPDATTWVDCDVTALMELRDTLNEDDPAARVTPLAIIMRACIAGLREFPMLNARLDVEAGEIVVQHFVHLGFAAQTDRGLVVPVIKDADRRSALDIARELRRLATGAREGALSPAELTGGTFTVSNYGSFGVDGGSAVINHPEVAILGTGRISDRPWVVHGAVAVRKVMQLSIAFDHRVADGGEAAGFLRYVGDCVESPTRLLGSL